MRKKMFLGCYGAAALIYLLMALFCFARDTLAFANGTLVTKQLTVSDFDLVDLAVRVDGTLISTGSDPQLIYTADGTVRTLSYSLSKPCKGTSALYYLEAGQTDFSARQVVLSAFDPGKDVFYALPALGRVDRLRVDLGNYAGEEYHFSAITLNPHRPFFHYFSLTLTQGLLLLTAPLLLCSLLITLTEAWHGGLSKKDKTAGTKEI